ncbi:anti-sigma factor RsbA family regulatory protein [Mycolicibacterium pallens]|uniref:Sensor histidine kinase n=1 Tax=Mycolicibacterium pallens TaxID=370524 RepID=A0ABX8VSI4_9MYCO|nr:anti-sigma factor RsbA family regulatory protein [Mycolicibacterium pallens]QYL18860.1 sensor histidine kinase [Mycolicibacterium pallens]
MRSGAASGTKGYFHEAALYGSDDEFLAIVLPFLADGVAAGEPTLVTLGEANSQLVRSALTKTRGISFLSGEMQYARPAASIRAYQELMAEHTRKGATQIRIVGDVPHPGVGVEWGWWARYEAAVNDAYNAYPVWGLCPYDVRHTPAEVLADVTRTHPHLATVDGGHVINPDFVDPTGFLAGLINNPPPPEPEPPSITLTNPTADAARSAVRRIAEQSLTALGDSTVSDMIFAVSEGVDNAMVYGTAPTTLRIWNYRDRLVAHVTDAGAGPTDPYAGLLRASDTTGAGLGLWLAHQMCADVTLHRHRGGFTLRIATTNN